MSPPAINQDLIVDDYRACSEEASDTGDSNKHYQKLKELTNIGRN